LAELERLLLETPYVNPYTLYLYHILLMKMPNECPSLSTIIDLILTKPIE
jgi:hypothetical protein